MKSLPRSLILLACMVSTATLSRGQRPGDEWVTVRGDQTPGLTYYAATTTTSGRIVAVGNGGSLMTSNDGGANWEFGQIEINGTPVRGSITSIYQVPNGSLIAVMVRLEEANVGFFKYQARSYFLVSTDNGNNWSMSPFPKTFATFRGNGRAYHGVNITGLQMGPGGQLLAYGTISGTNNGITLWSLGGLIFRQTGGSWEQELFEYGPVGKIASAGGRAVATCHNAILDSADGAGWNGYEMSDAQVTVDGQPIDSKTRNRLRVLDVEVLGNGNYIAQGGTFVPYGSSTNIDTNIFEKVFSMSSPTPFSGARNWTAVTDDYHGPYTRVGDSVISAGAGGAYYTQVGGRFALGGADVRAPGTAIAVSGATTAVAVQSSETVWKSTNSGQAWVKVWDKDIGPDLQLRGYANGTLFARANNELWLSRDNGSSWQKSDTSFTGSSTILESDGGRLFSAAGPNVLVSDDGGTTWVEKSIGTNRGGFLLVRSATGRLIMPVRGWDVRNEGKFYVSDDNGETWSPRNAGLAFGEEVRAAVQTKSGRLIVASNTFSLFNPALHYSDDDGETWTSSTVLQSLEGLDTVTGDPATKVIQITRLRASSSGRVLAMGDHTILTSDDDGDTWVVRTNLDFNGTGPLDALDLRDVIQVGSRWIAIGSYSTPFPRSRTKHFLLISDDDGATWGMRPFETNQSNTFLYQLAEAENGRVVIVGGNASVFISDSEQLMLPQGESIVVREGKIESVPISRPDFDGIVEVNFSTLARTAVPDVDFKPIGGTLRWEADDMEDKFIALEILDNNVRDRERELLLQLGFETDSGFLGQMETSILIDDNDSGAAAGLIFDGIGHLYTSEAGAMASLGIALETKPTADVTVTVSGLDASEGQLSGDTFTFTPEDWGRQQTLTITGVDDPDPDGDSTYNLTFTLTTDDTSYANLSTTNVAVVNVGDEPLPPIGPVILSRLPVTFVTTADGSFLLTATGLDPDAVYQLESSDSLTSFANGQQVTGAQLMSGFAIPKNGTSNYFRIRESGQ
ncbi:MAG: hypothetical protein KDN22_01490 [Verrucomicrobiae bacterium]|nr:hypothetical protein [Verrucomicrobiae bacterium]